MPNKPNNLLKVMLALLVWGVFMAEAFADEKDNTATWWAFWERPAGVEQHVRVVEAFVNLRSGPGSAYPVFHSSERDEILKILHRKTDWIKVEDVQQHQGWIRVADLQSMQNISGKPIELAEPRFDDYTTHPWEAGLLAGSFDDSAVNAGYIGYWLTDNLSAELWASQVLGDASESQMFSVNIVHQVFPTWRFSPFFTLGAGKLFIEPKATLSQENKRTEEIINAGLGFRFYLSHRYFLRFEFKDYKIFTNRDTNEEANEWKLGLSVFF